MKTLQSTNGIFRSDAPPTDRTRLSAPSGKGADSRAAFSHYKWALHELRGYGFTGTELDEVVVDALGISADPRAPGVIQRWMTEWPVARESALEHSLLQALCRLVPDHLAESIKTAKDLGETYRFLSIETVPTKKVLDAYRRVLARGSQLAAEKLAEWDPSFRRQILDSIRRRKRWEHDRWPKTILRYVHPGEVWGSVAPFVTDIDHDTAGALLDAIFFWPPGPWDNLFNKLLEIGPEPLLETDEGDLSPILLCDPRAARLRGLLQTLSASPLPDSSAAPLKAIHAAAILESTRIHTSVTELARRMRAFAPGNAFIPGSTARLVGSCIRLLISQGMRVSRDWLKALIGRVEPDDKVGLALGMGHFFARGEVEKTFEKERRRMPSRRRGQGATRMSDWVWRTLSLVARAVRRPGLLGELSCVDIRHFGLDPALIENELWGVSPGLSAWLRSAPAPEAYKLRRHLEHLCREYQAWNPARREAMPLARVVWSLMPDIPRSIRLMQYLHGGFEGVKEAVALLENHPLPSLVCQAVEHFMKFVHGGFMDRLRHSREKTLRVLAAVCAVRYYAINHSPSAQYYLPVPHDPVAHCRPHCRYQRMNSGSITVSRLEMVHEAAGSGRSSSQDSIHHRHAEGE